MPFDQDLNVYLRARFTLMILQTTEEERSLQIIKAVCESAKRPCISWDVADGFQLHCGSVSLPAARDPITTLEHIDKAEGNAVYVLRDFHDCWKNEVVKRKLRSVVQRLKTTKKSIVVTTPTNSLPDELKDEAFIIELSHPGIAELDQVLNQLTQVPGVKMNLTALGREKLLKAALGMTASQAQRVFAKAIVSRGSLDDRDIGLVTEEKKQIIRESRALEFFAFTETPQDIGGLGVLKDWLRLREQAFTEDARSYGLPAPKGIALIGIPGTGKSLTAKMIGGLWGLPLLRLDVGSLFGSLIGESEERTRQALHIAETVAPCVLWIDELEKAFASGGLDGGTSMRVFGSILTWMQEKTAPCFVVATANNIKQLPPELLRRGRFDEIFFLDLPTSDERQEIFSVHLKKRKRLIQDFDLVTLAKASQGYVGAELEQAIIDAMYLAFNDRRREFTTGDILQTLSRQVPLSVSSRETIEFLRNWLREGRAQSASFQEAKDAVEQFVPLQLELDR